MVDLTADPHPSNSDHFITTWLGVKLMVTFWLLSLTP